MVDKNPGEAPTVMGGVLKGELAPDISAVLAHALEPVGQFP